MIQSCSVIVPGQLSGERLDIAAVALLPEFSRKKIKGIIDNGGAYINKRRVTFAKVTVKMGDRIELFWEESAKAASAAADFSSANSADNKKENQSYTQAKSGTRPGWLAPENIIMECDTYLVINKPAGLASQATLTSDKDTLIHAVSALDHLKFPLSELFLVHRLDKETSGLIVLARTKPAQKFFEDAFRERRVGKVYEALCHNFPDHAEGSITFPIAKDMSRPNAYNPLMRAPGKSSSAKSAETDFKVTETFSRIKASRVECFPKTGRTHQIRVHLMAIGCPIIGDKTYGRGVVGSEFGRIALRHMLHAKRIEFADMQGEKKVFEAALPKDFDECLEALQAREKQRERK